MPEFRFSISDYLLSLEASLSKLHLQKQIAFGAWCSERLLPAYQTYARNTGASNAIRPILDRIWKHVDNEPMSPEEINQHLAACVSIPIKQRDSGWNEAIDAVDSVILVLQGCQQATTNKIAKAAECALNRANRLAEYDILDPSQRILTPTATKQLLQDIYKHPAFQSELSLQAKQLSNLQGLEDFSLERVMNLA